MSSVLVKSEGHRAACGKRSRRRYAACSIALYSAVSGCSSDVIDAGDLVETGEAGASTGLAAPDAGGSPGGGSCSIPGLSQYRLVFDSDDGRLERRIYSMRADGTEVEPLTPVEELSREPAMSPDGAQLAYATPEGIKLLDMASGQAELLLPEDSQPDWSSDGTHLVYKSRQFGVTILSLADRSNIRSFGCYTCLDAAMAPDGAHVVYSDANTSGVADRQFTVTAANWQTGGRREVVPATPIPIINPTVSPDGVWIAASYQCPREDRSSLWVSPFAVLTPACEGRRTTRAGSASATNPKWGPGLLIAYERGEPPRDIAIVAADTGEECVIERPGDDRNPSWASDVFDAPK